MRSIVMRVDGMFSSIEIFRQVLGVSPVKAITVAEVRARSKILDKLDEPVGEVFQLTEAEWTLLKQCIETFGFSIAHSKLVRVFDDVDNAVSTPD